jgi:catechol-2,3-dioxygenase
MARCWWTQNRISLVAGQPTMMERMSYEYAHAITGISHIDLSVSDRERSARWYQSVLGFELQGHHVNEDTGLPWSRLFHPAGLN